MLIESVRQLQERLEALPDATDIRQHIPAETVGLKLYRSLITDYSMDAELFQESVRTRGWTFEHVGSSDAPMFALVFTPKGMVTITREPTGEASPAARQWINEYRKRTRSPLQRMVDCVKAWFS